MAKQMNPLHGVKREWDEHDRAAEREAQHSPGHYNKRMRYRSGLERGECTDSQWDDMVNRNR